MQHIRSMLEYLEAKPQVACIVKIANLHAVWLLKEYKTKVRAIKCDRAEWMSPNKMSVNAVLTRAITKKLTASYLNRGTTNLV